MVLQIENNDLNADWLKVLDGGSYQQEDLAAHEKSAKKIDKSSTKSLSLFKGNQEMETH